MLRRAGFLPPDPVLFHLKPKTFRALIAGEASGDLLAAELVSALRTKVLEAGPRPNCRVQPLRTELAPQFFGVGGPRMAAAGVDLAFDLTQALGHRNIGRIEALPEVPAFVQPLLELAMERKPDVSSAWITAFSICVSDTRSRNTSATNRFSNGSRRYSVRFAAGLGVGPGRAICWRRITICF